MESDRELPATASTTVPVWIGTSRDGRTGRWRVECPACAHKWVPQTTLMARQHLVCPKPKCGAEMAADYNNDLVRLIAREGKGE
jgi:hypothetical protein